MSYTDAKEEEGEISLVTGMAKGLLIKIDDYI